MELKNSRKGIAIGQIECDLCKKKISYCKRIEMVNKTNNNKLNVCKECYDEFLKNIEN